MPKGPTEDPLAQGFWIGGGKFCSFEQHISYMQHFWEGGGKPTHFFIWSLMPEVSDNPQLTSLTTGAKIRTHGTGSVGF